MDKKKVLVGLLFLLFLIEITPTIVTNSQTPPSASAYVSPISVTSNPFILDTATLPAINQLGSNIRFFQYPNLTGQLYAYEQQLPQTTPTVDSVESTAWKVLPYWENGELVINSTGASTVGQYIAWKYSPISNVINVTIHVTSFPSRYGNPGIIVYSPNIGDQAGDNIIANFQAVLVTFGGLIWFHSPTSGYVLLYSSLPQPNPNYPFTFSLILTENSGNVTVSTVYINSTTYTVNVNTPLPWSQIGYVGIRGEWNDIFYVSYFGVSPSPYYNAEQFVNDVESTTSTDYWQNGQLCINSINLILTITNSQTSPTPSPWVQEIVLSSSNTSSFEWNLMASYHFANVYFTLPNGSIAPSWLENYTSTYAIWWVRTPGIPASSSIQLDVHITNFNAIQAYYPLVGEAPVLSPQYDNGNHVFYFYANGSTLSGWLTHGYAGVSSSSNGVDRVPPANGLPFNGYAFYANSSIGSYLNTSVGSLPTDNVIIEYYTYTTALGDLFFFTNYNGYGQMARVGGGIGWYGIATTNSWTSWNGPSGTGYYSGRWVLVGVGVGGTQATEYLSNVTSRMLYGQEILSIPSRMLPSFTTLRAFHNSCEDIVYLTLNSCKRVGTLFTSHE